MPNPAKRAARNRPRPNPAVLQILRERREATYAEMAERTGFTLTYLNAVHRGRRPAGKRVTRALADYYGLTRDELCGMTVETAEDTGQVTAPAA